MSVEGVTGGTTRLLNIGDKWEYFQTVNFKSNTQPLYALIAPDGTLLNDSVGYTPDADTYARFLDCGLRAYEEIQGKESLGLR